MTFTFLALSLLCLGLVLSQTKVSETECPDPPPCLGPPDGCTLEIDRDSNGCMTGCSYHCICSQKGGCLKDCKQYGYVKDEDGCDTCKCRCGPTPNCATPPPGCETVLSQDENGCATSCDIVCTSEET